MDPIISRSEHNFPITSILIDSQMQVKLNGVTTLSIPYDTAGAYQLPLDLTHIRGHVTVELLMTNKHRLVT